MMAKGQLNTLIYYQVSIADKEGREIVKHVVCTNSVLFSTCRSQTFDFVRNQRNSSTTLTSGDQKNSREMIDCVCKLRILYL